MSRRRRFCSIARDGDLRRGLRRLGDQLAGRRRACSPERAGASASSSATTSPAGASGRRADLTLPGFTHEVLASWHPLFTGSAAYAELKDELDRRGVTYVNTDLPTGKRPSPTARRRSSRARSRGTWPSSTGSRRATAPPGSASSTRSWPTPISPSGSFGTELWSTAGALARPQGAPAARSPRVARVRRHDARQLPRLGHGTFQSEAAHGVLAPWVLHTGLGPDQATSGLHDAGDRRRAPTRRHAGPRRRRRPPRRRARRRSSRTPAARCGSRPTSSASSSRTAARPVCGSRTARSSAPPAPSSRTSPRPSSTGRLLGGSEVPARSPRPRRASATAGPRCRSTSRSTSRRAGRAPRPSGSARCPIVHVTPGLDGVSRAVNEAERGLLPAEATIVCGQPAALDPSRAPDGKSLLWIQLQELPAGHGQGRRGRRDRHRRRHVERGAARGVCRPDRRPARRVDREPRRGDPEARRRSPPPTRGAQRQPRRRRHLRRARARSTRTSSGARLPRRPVTRRPSRGSGTSVRAPTPARGSAPAPATSSRRS